MACTPTETLSGQMSGVNSELQSIKESILAVTSRIDILYKKFYPDFNEEFAAELTRLTKENAILKYDYKRTVSDNERKFELVNKLRQENAALKRDNADKAKYIRELETEINKLREKGRKKK